MEIFNYDFSELITISNLMAIILGTFVGLLIGALPGLGTMIAIILLLPVTYVMSPLAAILLLLAAYQGSEYGGSISSITLGVPGTPAAAATILDGNALAKKGFPGKALGYSLTASTIGGLFGGLVLMFFSVPLAKFALRLSDPEFFLICLIGLMAVGMLSSKDITKSLISVVLGLIAGTVGMDLLTGTRRFTLERPELMDGVNLVALLVGVFALSEIFSMISDNLNRERNAESTDLKTRLSGKELKSISKPISIGSIIGALVGIFPGLGAGASSWFSYTMAKKFSKKPETFGEGNPEGIAAPESANNATVGGSLVPLLALGIPGSPAMAIIMGAFIIHGIQPGPTILASETNLVYGIFYGFIITTIAMFVLGKIVTSLFARVLIVPNSILVPIVLILCIVGIYASKYMFFDIWLALGLGIVCFFLKRLDFSLPSIILAFVLGPIMEVSLRRTLVVSNGSYSVFFTRFYSVLLILIILVLVIAAVINWRNKKRNQILS